jgi:glutathione S-transferase
MHAGFPSLRSFWPMNLNRRNRPLPPTPEVAEDVERIQQIWTNCRLRFGAKGPYLFGSWTAADAVFAPVVTRFISYGAKVGGEPKAYMDAVEKHPWMREWAAEAAREPWAIAEIDEL